MRQRQREQLLASQHERARQLIEEARAARANAASTALGKPQAQPANRLRSPRSSL